MSAYERLPTPSLADAKAQIAGAVEFGCFVLMCEWVPNHKDGRVERQFQTYSATRLEGVENALGDLRHGPALLDFAIDVRELLATDLTATEEKFDESTGIFVSGEISLYRPEP